MEFTIPIFRMPPKKSTTTTATGTKRKANSNNNSNNDNTKKKKKPTKKTESTKKKIKKTKSDYPEHKCDMKKFGSCNLCNNPPRVIVTYKAEIVTLILCTSCFWRAMNNHKLFTVDRWICCGE